MSEKLRFAATAFLTHESGEQAVRTPIDPINALLARAPDRAARNWYWRLTPAQRARCVRVMVEPYAGPSPYPLYQGRMRLFLAGDGWRDVTGHAPVLVETSKPPTAPASSVIATTPALVPVRPADRAGAVSQELERIFRGEAPTASPRPVAPARPHPRRARAIGAVGAVIAVGLVSLGVGVSVEPLPIASHPPADRATMATAPPVQITEATADASPKPAQGALAGTAAPKPHATAPQRLCSGRCTYADVLSADTRLRRAYGIAVAAGVRRPTLVAYRERWAGLRDDAARQPGATTRLYVGMADDLKDAARRARAGGRGRADARGLDQLWD
jgi:hypothetical protein